MPLEAKDTWRGPLKVTYLKARLRDFAHDLDAITDVDEIAPCIELYRDALVQAKHDLPDWHESANQALANKTDEVFQSQEQQYGFSGEK